MNLVVLAGAVSGIEVSHSENGAFVAEFSIAADRLMLDAYAVGRAAEIVRDAGEGAALLFQGRLRGPKLFFRTVEPSQGSALNRVMLARHTGRNAEEQTTKNDKHVAKLSLAVKVCKDETAWFPVRLWERNAQTASNYVGKGSIVGVEGRDTLLIGEGGSTEKRDALAIGWGISICFAWGPNVAVPLE